MFAEKLKELRKSKKHLTQQNMADILGVAKTTYASYEQGKRTPDTDLQNKIADYFGVSLDYLHGRTEDKEKGPTLVAAHLDDDLTEEQLDEVKSFIDFIKQRDHGK